MVLKYILANELEASFIMPVMFRLPVLNNCYYTLVVELLVDIPGEITLQSARTSIHSGYHVAIICPHYTHVKFNIVN